MNTEKRRPINPIAYLELAAPLTRYTKNLNVQVLCDQRWLPSVLSRERSEDTRKTSEYQSSSEGKYNRRQREYSCNELINASFQLCFLSRVLHYL